MSEEQGSSAQGRPTYRGSPRQLSQQLGIPIQDILSAIEFAQIEALQSESGQLEFEIKSVVSAYLEQNRQRDAEQTSRMQSMLRECLDAYQESVRQMIREENRVAYQIKDMTESRFLEVLGQVSLSIGRVEAFVMQGARLLSQLDIRMSRLDEHKANDAQVPVAAPASAAQQAPLKSVIPAAQARQLSNSEHWKEFETQMTRLFAAQGKMADSAIADWLASAKALLNLGSLELRLNGEHLLEAVRPALMDNSFAGLHFSLPADDQVLPAFENFQNWIRTERAQGHSAILLYLILILNRGPQISWSGFVMTFVQEV
ncbi:MAG: hypothetical protein RLZZ488_683 [Pseudomonadota bacterium]